MLQEDKVLALYKVLFQKKERAALRGAHITAESSLEALCSHLARIHTRRLTQLSSSIQDRFLTDQYRQREKAGRHAHDDNPVSIMVLPTSVRILLLHINTERLAPKRHRWHLS